MPTDVRVSQQVEHLCEETVRQFGGIDILVNNAAGNFIARLKAFTQRLELGREHCSQWNLLLLVQKVVAHDRKRPGREHPECAVAT